MRVVHISKVVGIAGSEGHLLRLLPGLAGKGLEIHALVLEEAHRSASGFVEALGRHGIAVERIPIRGHFDPTLGRRLTERLRAIRPILVHTHLLHADLYGLPAARRAGIPHAISSRHNDDLFRRNAIWKWVNQRIMQHANRVIAISHALAKFVCEVEGVDQGKVVTIHYGLEAPPLDPVARSTARAKLGYAEQDMIVGMFGRLIRQKGVDVLLRAFPLVQQAHPAARLLIVGDGPQRLTLERLAAALGLTGTVCFAGWIEGARRLMPACDVIAVPSRWEGFGLVTLEAMSWALPIVASRVSALPEIVVDGETGLLVPPDKVEPLADAITCLLADKPRALAMGRAGYRRLANSFSVEKMVCATLEVYKGVVGQE